MYDGRRSEHGFLEPRYVFGSDNRFDELCRAEFITHMCLV